MLYNLPPSPPFILRIPFFNSSTLISHPGPPNFEDERKKKKKNERKGKEILVNPTLFRVNFKKRNEYLFFPSLHSSI